MLTNTHSLWRYRDAVYNLALLNLRLRYSNSLLGALWSLLNPLFFMLVFTFVFTELLASPIPNFPVFVLSALLPWNYFQAMLNSMTVSVTNARDLIARLNFPREILPLAAALTELVTFSVALSAITLVLTLTGQGPGIALLALPLLVVLMTLFAAGVGLALAAINVRLRDVQEFMGVFLFGWFFLTPIVYSLDSIPAGRQILGLDARALVQVVNPIAPLVAAFRQVLYERHWPDASSTGYAALMSLIVFAAGFALFRRLRRGFAETM